MRKSIISRYFGVMCLILMMVSIVSAQATGQICIRSFDDRNNNGVFEAGDPPITRGITASLLDAENVIIRTLLLEDSPQATQGIMCFQQLEAGQYTVQVASADYASTTTDTFVTAVTTTSIAQVFDFGAQVIIFDVTDNEPIEDTDVRASLARILFASLGALVSIGAMIVLGSIIYFFFLRSKASPASAYAMPMSAQPPIPAYARTATSEIPAVQPTSGRASIGGYVPSGAVSPPTPPTPMKPITDDFDDLEPFDEGDFDAPRPPTPTTSSPITPPSTPAVPSTDDDSDAIFKPPAGD